MSEATATKPDEGPRARDTLPRYVAADMFCGCGGLSLGLSLTRRFDTALGLDIRPEAVETFVRNHERDYTPPVGICADIREASADEIGSSLIDRGVTRAGDLACLIGGPPCEGFSQNRSLNAGGKRNGSASRIDKFVDDPRNQLFKWFIEIAEALKPKVVLIENVPDLVRHREGETRAEILDALAVAGYRTTVRVLNAADFGVPQIRRRAFFLAQRIDDFKQTGMRLDFPLPTHSPYLLAADSLAECSEWFPGDAGYWPSVFEAIGDLPAPTMSDASEQPETGYPDAPMSLLRRFLRDPSGRGPANHVARPLGESGLRRVKEMSENGTRRLVNGTPRRRQKHYHNSYTRLRWAEPARTITKFAYHVGSGMFAHPEEDRAITMREAARLQTFPDSFTFHARTIRQMSALVGGAVPPLLAYRLGQAIVRYLDSLEWARLHPEARREAQSFQGDAVLRRLETREWSSERPQGRQLELDDRQLELQLG